jgi:hypothetical protein
LKYIITKSGGLGDVMGFSLFQQEIGRIFKHLFKEDEIHVILNALNPYSKEWYDWIPNIKVHSFPFWDGNPERIDYYDLINYFLKDGAEYFPTKPSPGEIVQNPFPNFDLPRYRVVVQPFAGTEDRCVFFPEYYEALDRPNVCFIGKETGRKKGFYEAPYPCLKYATDYTNQLSVMETFYLLRNADWYVGTHSAFFTAALALDKNILCLLPKYSLDAY